MPIEPVIGNSGVGATRTATPRTVCKADPEYLPGGATIDGSESRDPGNGNDTDVLRAGLVMGKITATGKYAPSILGTLAVALGSAATEITLPAETVSEISRRIGPSGTFTITGPPSAGGTVASEQVTYSAIASATTITITPTGTDYAEGSIVQPDDGSEAPLCLIDNGYGIKVTDVDRLDVDVDFPVPLIGGTLISEQIIEWPTDTSMIDWLKGQLNNASGSRFVFDDAYKA